MTPVIVVWTDAYGDTGSSYESPREALEGYQPCVRRSIGHFLGYCGTGKNAAVSIATEDDRAEGSTRVGGVHYIPTAWIHEIKVIE